MFEFLMPLFEGLGSLGEMFGSAASGVGEAVGSAGAGIGEAFGSAGSAIGSGFGELGGGALGFAEPVAGEAAAGGAGSAFAGVGGEAVPFQNIGGLGNPTGAALGGVSETASSGVNSLFQTGAGTAGATATGAGAAAKAAPGMFESIVSGAGKSIANNPLGTAAAGVGLGMNLLRGNPTDPNQAKLQATANELGEQGKMFQNYLATGTLPPAMQAQLTQATEAAKARIISNHARNGMPTDPSQNSALAAELNAVDLNAVGAMAQAQMDMLKTGLNETGLSTQLYETLVKMDRQNNTDLMNAISSFASALGGGSNKGANGKGTTITVN